MKAICVSAISSNQGKTLLTTALLHYFRKSVRAYKIGPDYIDPQFHEIICSRPSINLDTFMMNKNQVKWIFNKYRYSIFKKNKLKIKFINEFYI